MKNTSNKKHRKSTVTSTIEKKSLEAIRAKLTHQRRFTGIKNLIILLLAILILIGLFKFGCYYFQNAPGINWHPPAKHFD